MSQADAERFVEDLKSDADMRNALRDETAGVGFVTEFAQA